jgi:hypothetical protein
VSHMLDPNTGLLVIDSPRGEIGPSLTRTRFLETPAFSRATISVKNEPWCSWVLKGQRIGQDEFAIVIYFYGEEIRTVVLQNASPALGTSWADYTEEKERLRKNAHDKWVRQNLAGQKNASWGTVKSVFDQIGGFSCIKVSYNTSASPSRLEQ